MHARRKILRTALIAGSALGLSIGGSVLPLAAGAAAQASTTCAAAWSSTTAYTAGEQASESSVNYTAAFGTEGNNHATNNGGSGSGEPWISDGACSGSGSGGGGAGTCAAAWSSTTAYTAGEQASESSVNYTA